MADVEQHYDSVGNDKIEGNVDGAKNTIVGNHNRQSVWEKDFVGRDQKISTTIYESADNVAAMRHQLARLEDNTQWRLAMLEQKIDNITNDFQTFRNSLMAGYVRLPNNEPPNQMLLYVMVGALLVLIIILVGLAVYWSIRQPLSSPQSISLPALPSAFSTISTLFTFF